MEKNKHDNKHIHIMSYASCYGAQDHRCASGPVTLKNLGLSARLKDMGFNTHWTPMIQPMHNPISPKDNLGVIKNNCKELADQTHLAVARHKKIIVIGGDHACAIGTWSGVQSAMSSGDFGLIWIDAHMDSHTSASSPSGAIHGMPIAALLGYGEKTLCNIKKSEPKIKPENLCLIGIRSFEPAEKILLDRLNVKIFYMADVKKHGLTKIMKLAKQHVTKTCNQFGVTLDLDAIDPEDAPGVGSREVNGLSGNELICALKACAFDENFIGIEVVELNADKDIKDKTAELAIDIIIAAYSSVGSRSIS